VLKRQGIVERIGEPSRDGLSVIKSTGGGGFGAPRHQVDHQKQFDIVKGRAEETNEKGPQGQNGRELRDEMVGGEWSRSPQRSKTWYRKLNRARESRKDQEGIPMEKRTWKKE